MKTHFYSLPEQFGQKEHQFSIFPVDLNCLHNLNYGSDKCISANFKFRSLRQSFSVSITFLRSFIMTFKIKLVCLFTFVST